MTAPTFEWARGALGSFSDFTVIRIRALFCLCHVRARSVQEMHPASLSASRNRMHRVYLEKRPCLALGSEMRIGAGCLFVCLLFPLEPLQAKINMCFFDSVLSLLDILANQSSCLLIRSGVEF